MDVSNNSVANLDPRSGAYWPLDPGSRDGLKIRIRIQDEQPGSCFQELRQFFFGLNTEILWCGSRIRDGKNSDPGWKKFGSGINIPDPQQWQIENKNGTEERFCWPVEGGDPEGVLLVLPEVGEMVLGINCLQLLLCSQLTLRTQLIMRLNLIFFKIEALTSSKRKGEIWTIGHTN